MKRPPNKFRAERFGPHGEAEGTSPGGRLVRLWQGIPGESALIELQGGGAHQVQARWLSSPEPHPLRRDPPCDRYSPCGGCPLMHLQPDGQRRARLSLLRSALTEEGLGERCPAEIVPSPDGDEAYRHLVKLAAGWSDMGRLRLGAYGRGTHQVVPIPDCLAATPTLRRAMAVISHLVIERELEPWDPESGQGWLRHVVLRQSRSSGKVLATLVVGRAGGPVRGLGHAFMESMGEVCGVHLHINDQPGNAIFASPAPDEEPGARFQIVGGAHTLIEELNGVKVGIGAGDFFQTNPAMASRIFSDIVADFAELKDRPVVDLYCGVGALTLQLARQHGWALGAEVVPGAVERAAENALLNHLPARFLGGPVAELLPQIEEATRGRAPLVVVDPARRGLEEGVIADLLRLEPALIAYLSCNPRALARDLSLLLAQGWKLRSLRAYDMFPQTAHVETLAMLEPPVAPSPTTRAPQRRIVRAV